MVTFFVTMFTMFIIGRYDLRATMYLRQFSHLPWLALMDQSMFEGDFFGAGDFTIFVYALVLFLYLCYKVGAKYRQGATLMLADKIYFLERVLIAGLLVVVATHGLKWLVGRPRPTDILGGNCEFQPWFQLSSEDCSRRTRGGSFPSGHTANAASLVFPVVAWIEYRRKTKAQSSPNLKWIVLGILFYGILMGISRVMHGDHWLTDIWGSLCINLYILCFWWSPCWKQVLGFQKKS